MNGLYFDVAGAEGPKQYFARITTETLSHAYLFAGERGVGKKTFARRLAQSLLCEAPKDTVLGYDGTCASCRLFASLPSGRHPDFLEHDGVLKIGESDSATSFSESEDLTARDLVRQLSLQSYSGGLRVLLLGDIDFATHHAANALLKFFEEPPRGVVLILTSAAPGRLLPTIRSRVIELRFPRLSQAQIREILLGLGRDEAQAQLGASLGQGSVTRALAALEGEEESLRAQVARWFVACVRRSTGVDSWASRETLGDGLDVVKSLARDWIAFQTAGPSAPPSAPDFANIVRDLPPLPAPRAIALLTKLDDAARLSRTNVNPAMVAEIVRMTLSASA